MRNRFGIALTVLGVVAGFSWADPIKPPKLNTVTYDVSDLLRKPDRTGYADIGDIVKVIVTSVEPQSWNPPGDNTLEEINGSKLQITTTLRLHAEIVELLAAAGRRIDLRVDFKCELYEVERKIYDKEIKKKLKDKGATEPEDDVLTVLRERGTRLKESEAHVADGAKVRLFSQQRAYTFVVKPGAAGKSAVYDSGLAGLRVTADVAVTADRRYVKLKLTQHVTELLEIKKETVINRDNGEDEEIEVPHITERSETVNVMPGDGGAVLLRVTLADGKDTERVRVLVVQPRLYIEEEERERKKQMP